MPKTSRQRSALAPKTPAPTPITAPDPSDEYLTTEEAGLRLKRSPRVLAYWRMVGQGPPYYRQGRVVRYLLSEVMGWGASQRVTGRDTAA